MKNIYSLLFAGLLLGALLSGCKKNVQDKVYKDSNRILISADPLEGALVDSIQFSFAILDNAITERKLSVMAYTMGNVSDQPREFKLGVDPTSTALPEEYVLPATFLIPAGAAVARIPMTVKRTTRLVNTKAKLILNVQANENFQIGTKVLAGSNQVGNMMVAFPSKAPTFTYIWTSQLTRPANWATGTWGVYSYNKHKLLIDAQDVYKDLSLIGSSDYTTYYFIAAKATKALFEYNLANPGKPLLNDQGLPIQICGGNGCQ